MYLKRFIYLFIKDLFISAFKYFIPTEPSNQF